MLKVSFAAARSAKNKSVIITIAKGAALGEQAKKLDKQLDGALDRGLKSAPSFKGKEGQSLLLRAPSKTGPSLVVFVGVGVEEDLDNTVFEKAGGVAYSSLAADGEGECSLIIDQLNDDKDAQDAAAMHAAFGAQLSAYRFDKYRTKSKKPLSKLKSIAAIVSNVAEAKKEYVALQAIAHGVYLTRDVVSEPANTMHPEALADEARDLEKYGIEVEVLGEEEMEALGMGSLLCVSQGSDRPAQLAIMKWMGAESKEDRPIAFVGKGVTFDTGGISLKPPPGMGDMKFDMAGAGAVLGVMKTLAMRKAEANVIGIMGLVENMPSSNAVRPGDVVKSASGQTIEVLNTDAEGRLVLADALWYVQKHFRPKVIVDLATLTGAIMVSLGEKYGGMFANDDDLAFALAAAGEEVDEPLWRMPLHKDYDKLIDSPIADMKNIGGKYAGSVTAAQFLQRFVNKNTAWAHLDIAGMAWTTKASSVCPKGATGYGVRLLDQFVSDFVEQ